MSKLVANQISSEMKPAVMGGKKAGNSVEQRGKKKEQKFSERLSAAMKRQEIDLKELEGSPISVQRKMLEYLIETNQVEKLREWQESSLEKQTTSLISGLDYALRKKRFAVIEVLLSKNPYEKIDENHLYGSILDCKALGVLGVSVKNITNKSEDNNGGTISVNNYVSFCLSLVKNLDPMQLKQVLSKIEKTVSLPTEEQWGKLYLSQGKLSESLTWCAMHSIEKNENFLEHLFDCISSQQILKGFEEEVRLVSDFIKKNIKELSQRHLNFWYKESIRTENEDLFVALLSSGRKPKDWLLETSLPGSWANIRYKSSSLRSGKAVHVVHYALGLEGINGEILDWLVSAPEVLESLKNYKPSGGSLAALSSVEVKRLAKLGVDIESPLDEYGNRLLHFWVAHDGEFPRSGWGTMLKNFKSLSKPNNSGVTAEQAQRNQLRKLPTRLREFDLSLAKSQAKEIERGLVKVGHKNEVQGSERKSLKML